MKISVCIATYNGEKHIREQLDSIIPQIGIDDEIIISDDGSTDKTIEIIKSYNDKRIIVKHHQKKASNYRFSYTTKNLENALGYATGDYIFLSDQDDIWKENKVLVCIETLKKGYDLVLHDAEIINESNQVIGTSYFEINNSKKGILNNLINNSYLGCCMVINKSLLNKVIPFTSIPVPHDIWIGILYEYYGKVFLCKDKLISYRRHGANVSPSGEKSTNTIFFKILYRFNFVRALLYRIIVNKYRKL